MKKFTPDQAKQKILHYCAYQERSHQEVKSKLYSMGLHLSDVDELLSYLLTEGFLNEERFAKTYAGGKFRLKKWGKIKIEHALESKGLTKNCIRLGLKEIEEDEYEKTLIELLNSKMKTIEDSNAYSLRDRLSKFALQKGYEPELTWRLLRALIPD